MNKKRLQFIHIPKCAGMSVHNALLSVYKEENAKAFFGKGFGKGLWQVRWQETRWEHEESFLDFKQIVLQSYLAEGWRYIGGHLPFSPLAHNWHKESTWFVSVLREPFERTRSHLKYLLGKFEKKACKSELEEALRLKGVLGSWLEDQEFMRVICNQMCIYLGGLNYSCQARLSQMQEHAMAAIEALDLVGFVEELELFEENLGAMIGKSIEFGRENASKDYLDPLFEEELDSIIESRRDAIMEAAESDIALYKAARAEGSVIVSNKSMDLT